MLKQIVQACIAYEQTPEAKDGPRNVLFLLGLTPSADMEELNAIAKAVNLEERMNAYVDAVLKPEALRLYNRSEVLLKMESSLVPYDLAIDLAAAIELQWPDQPHLQGAVFHNMCNSIVKVVTYEIQQHIEEFDEG